MSGQFDPYYRWLGIPPQEQPPNAYRLLGIQPFEADSDVIETAADQRMMHLRTYQTGEHTQWSQRLLNEVAAAKVRLLDPEKKAEYDRKLHARAEAQQAATSGAAPVVVASGRSPRAVTGTSPLARLLPVVVGAAVVLLVGLGVFLAVRSRQTPIARQPEASDPATGQPAAESPPRTVQADSGTTQPKRPAEGPGSVVRQTAPRSPSAPSSPSTPPSAAAPAWPGVPPWAAAPPAGHPAAKTMIPQGPWAQAPWPQMAKTPPMPPMPSGPEPTMPDALRAVEGGATDLADMVERVEPSVVRISADGELGSGFVVDNTGLVATNYHVIEGALRATATFPNGRTAEVAGYAAVDPGKDLVLLRLVTTEKLQPIPLREDLPRKGERVAAFGAPQGFTGTVSQGIVSAVRKGKEVRDVFREIIGVDAYAWAGLDPEATWVQTTAPISPGNSGGPLVDKDGKVVAVNAWTRRDGQNLNFAVAAVELGQLLRTAGNDSRALATLGPRKTRPQGQVAVRSRFTRIELPSGATLTDAKVEIPAKWQDTLFPDEAPVYVPKHPNDEIKGVYTFDEGKLHGWAAVLSESGQLRILANYYQSLRDGLLRLWDENRQRLLYAEYTRGNKNGLVCLFRNGVPWLIEQWESAHLAGQYLVKWTGPEPSVLPRAALKGADAQEFAVAQKTLYELEAELEGEETELKRELREWYREEDQRIRQARAAKMSVKRQEAARKRRHARGAVEAAGRRNMWRAALGRSGF